MNSIENLIDTVNHYRSLGAERLENGTYLVGKVPHVAPHAWLHAIYPPLSPVQIVELEASLANYIPSAFKYFLSQMNGCSLFSGSLDIHGKRGYLNDRKNLNTAWQPFDIVRRNTTERIFDASEGHFFFGSYNWDGSLLYLDEKDRVHRCSRQSVASLNHWSDLNDFLASEVDRLNSLFDVNGKELNVSMPTIP